MVAEDPGLATEGDLRVSTHHTHRPPDPPGLAVNDLENAFINRHHRTPSPSLHENENGVNGMSSNCASTLGGTSIDQTLQQVELDLETHPLPTQGSRMRPTTQESSLNLDKGQSGVRAPFSARLRTTRLLQRHGLAPNENEWDELFSNFCEFVYPLFPFLHLPSLEATYSGLWALLRQQLYERAETVGPSADELAQVLICLALGRCTHSARTSAFEGFHSAGWKFYTAAAEVVGSLFDPICDIGATVERLQTLTCMVSTTASRCELRTLWLERTKQLSVAFSDYAC